YPGLFRHADSPARGTRPQRRDAQARHAWGGPTWIARLPGGGYSRGPGLDGGRNQAARSLRNDLCHGSRLRCIRRVVRPFIYSSAKGAHWQNWHLEISNTIPANPLSWQWRSIAAAF